MTECESIVAVDVGNSAIKVAVASRPAVIADHAADQIDNAAVLVEQTFPLDRSGTAEPIVQWVMQQGPMERAQWWVSTVNHAASRPLHEAVRSAGASWHALTFRDVPMRTRVDHPEKVGIDRLLSAYAATQRFDLPMVVVDAGSAVTVDHVCAGENGEAEFLGGAILPGIRLQLAALASGTEGLQHAASEIDSHPDGQMIPATETKQAIRLGVIAAVTGAIERLSREYTCRRICRSAKDCDDAEKCDLPQPDRIVLTGGDAALLTRYLREQHDVVPNLVCQGILGIAFRQCQNPAIGLKWDSHSH